MFFLDVSRQESLKKLLSYINILMNSKNNTRPNILHNLLINLAVLFNHFQFKKSNFQKEFFILEHLVSKM